MQSSKKNTRVLVVGASSKIGKPLVKLLLEKEFQVCALTSQSTFDGLSDEKFQLIRISNWTDFELSQIQPVDYVVYLSSQTSAYEAKKDFVKDANSNIISFIKTFQTLFFGNNCRPKVILAGSMTQYGLGSEFPIDESFPSSSPTFYELSKNVNEMYIKRFFEENLITGYRFLRLSNVYGFMGTVSRHRGFLDSSITSAIGGQDLFYYEHGNYLRDYIHFTDVLEAILAALDFDNNSYNGVYNIGSGEGTTIVSALRRISFEVMNRLNKHVQVISRSAPTDIYELEFRNSVVDIDLFSKHSGWSPKINFDFGIEKCISECLQLDSF